MYFNAVPFAMVGKYEQMHIWTCSVGMTRESEGLMPEFRRIHQLGKRLAPCACICCRCFWYPFLRGRGVTAPLCLGFMGVCKVTLGTCPAVALAGGFLTTRLFCRVVSKCREMKELAGSLLWWRRQWRWHMWTGAELQTQDKMVWFTETWVNSQWDPVS